MTVEPMPTPRAAADDAFDGALDMRAPRHDLDAERCVLGAVMLAPDMLDEVAAVVRAADFYRPAHQLVFEVVTDLARRGEPADAVTVHAALVDRGLAGKVGGGAYIAGLVEAPPSAASATYYAGIVRRCARMRGLVEAGTYLLQMGWEGDAEQVEEYLARAHEKLVAHDDGQQGDPPTFAERLFAVVDRIENGEDVRGRVVAPYADLETMLGGMRPGQLITIGARPSAGKSVCAADIARHAAMRQDVPVFMSSVEMNGDEIVQRIIAAETRVPLNKIRAGDLGEDEWRKVSDMAGRAMAAPLIIDDTPNITVDTIRASLRRMERRADVPAAGMLVVDYLQLMKSTTKAENRQVEVSELSRGLKLIAREFQIPVVMLAQLNRAPEARADKMPTPADLRESGAVEQDSDVVILIHREDMYDKESPRAGEADLIVGKNRNGPTGVVQVAFQGHYSRFVDMARNPEPSGGG